MQLFSQGDVSKARWISYPVIIDGNDTEWTKPLNFYDDISGIMYAVGNDKDNLYLCFTVNDEIRMKKLMSAGWTIGLSSKENKKKFKSEIMFPGVNVMGIRMSKNNFEKEKAADNFIKIYQLQMTKVSCKGFKSNISELALNNRENISIAIGADNTQHIIYEIAIPLKEFFASNLKNLHELITMNITVNALERPSGGSTGGRPSGMGGNMNGSFGGGRSGGGSRGGGRSGGMSGGMRGNGPGGEYRQGEQGDRGSMFVKTSFKQKFTLCSSK
ncbi:MAG TPA: hypothetical protein VIK10_09950 [Prolixibacteraceae bacterium]